ncbi:ABC-2 type transport system permease protein [Georgenia satyanarayanai]|uniref:ABC-2 type transport system permease protein n=1 Tax=Georgenia satyanarayanai TaxID=860221 RepID=A0A2Y9AM16_9MICO|nr:ABC transporter permease subunit [Georgenia satyanarayanai]PYF97784.1 ABC-2 type transport system permease protein [Georgenia satyanarayanai]SSA45524.1 ABC-2 type transport system permease protein [Georgenia satyanarayanai]
MMRLLRVELRRLFSRRLAVLTMLGALAASLLVLWGVWESSQPMSDEDLALAEEMYQQELAYWEEHGDEDLAACLEAEAEEAERLGEDATDWGCEEGHTAPEREWYIHTAPPLEETLPFSLEAVSTVLLFAVGLVGATFTAAEISTGAMSTWLSFEPRRLRVYASKVTAAALGVLPAAVLALAVVTGGAWLVADHFDLATGMGATQWADTGWMVLRILGLAVIGALVGAALGFLLRHTAAVLGLVVVGFIASQMVQGLVPRTAPWVPTTNVSGWVKHGTTYYVEECTTDANGMMCDYTEHALSFGHSAVYLLVLAAVVVALGAVVFRRRDAV